MKSQSNLIYWIDRMQLNATNISLHIIIEKLLRKKLFFPKRIFKYFMIYKMNLEEIFMNSRLIMRKIFLNLRSHNQIFHKLISHKISYKLI